MSGPDPYQVEYEELFDKAVGLACKDFNVSREAAREAFYMYSQEEEQEVDRLMAAREEHDGGDRDKHRAAVIALCKYVLTILRKYLKAEPSTHPEKPKKEEARVSHQAGLPGMEKRGYGGI